MSAVLERIEQTRYALLGALESRDWGTITELDLSCRVCVEDVLAQTLDNEQSVRSSLQDLLEVYRPLIDVACEERQTIVDEMAKIRQAKNAANIYHLFT